MVIRFSAMGDVALVVPVLKALAQQNEGLKILFVTKKSFASIVPKIEGCEVLGVDLKKEYAGFLGLIRLARKINGLGKFSHVIDLHSVIRSKILAFFIKKKKVLTVNKGRAEKKAFCAKENKKRAVLKHTTDRYCDVFIGTDFKCRIGNAPWLQHPEKDEECKELLTQMGLNQQMEKWIGIAPFAMHKGKIWPIEKIEEVINKLLSHSITRIFLFGAPNEKSVLEKLAKEHDRVHVMAGKLSLSAELHFISKLKCMLAMDSSNMHFAALSGVRTVSIWGATHPDVGFAPLGDNQDLIVQIDEETLSCRPCSVFGDKPCFRGDYACMAQIEPENVYKQICKAAGIITMDMGDPFKSSKV